MLDFGSKKRFCTLSQPPSPSWSIVNWPGRTGNFFRFFGYFGGILLEKPKVWDFWLLRWFVF